MTRSETTLLIKNFGPPFAFKKEAGASAVHTFEVRPENILSVRGMTVTIETMLLIDRPVPHAQKLAAQKQ